MNKANDPSPRPDVLLSRRSLVVSLAAAGAGIAGIPGYCSKLPDPLFALRSAFMSMDDAAKAGRVYLQLAPHEADVPHLIQRLFPLGVPNHIRQIRRVVSDARERDLRESRTLVLGRWLVAESEARWCALAYLLRNAP